MVEDMAREARGCNDARKGPQAKEWRPLLEAGQGKGTAAPLGSSEGSRLVGYLNFCSIVVVLHF